MLNSFAETLRKKEQNNVNSILKCVYERPKNGYGGHFVAHYKYHDSVKRKKSKATMDEVFQDFYIQALEANCFTVEKQVPYIIKLYIESGEIIDRDYVEKHCIRCYRNYINRVKRFNSKLDMIMKFRKGYEIYFVTFTYDDKKHTEDSFRKTLKKCFGNFHTRRGWLVMGVFERAPETQRLHFHGLLSCKKNQMVGKITYKVEYNPLTGRKEGHHSNSFFEKRFGRCDFAPIYCTDIMEEKLYHDGKRNQQVINYILKYIMKSGEKVFFTRGMATHLEIPAEHVEFASEFINFIQKFVLFDDTFNEGSGLLKHVRMRC